MNALVALRCVLLAAGSHAHNIFFICQLAHQSLELVGHQNTHQTRDNVWNPSIMTSQQMHIETCNIIRGKIILHRKSSRYQDVSGLNVTKIQGCVKNCETIYQ